MVLKRLGYWLLLPLLLVALLFYSLTIKGSVQPRKISSQDVRESHQLLKSSWQRLVADDQTQVLALDEKHLDALLNVATQSLRPITFHGSLTDFGLVIHGARSLPAPFSGRIFYFSCVLAEQPAGFAIESCKLGKLPLSGRLMMQLMRFSLWAFIQAPEDKLIYELFQSGRVEQQTLSFHKQQAMRIRPELAAVVSGGINLGVGTVQGRGAPLPLEPYFEVLTELAKAHPEQRQLAFYLQQMLREAMRRGGDSFEREASTALWALAISAADRRFLRFSNGTVSAEQVPELPPLLLSGRRDLALHFLYSAVIKMVGNQQLAIQIGALKELSDAGSGGSGFSFVDMAANKAGIWMVQQLGNIDRQQVFTLDVDDFEAAFMPIWHDLPEGLSERQLNQALGGPDGPGAQALLTRIEERLAALSLYRADTKPVAQLTNSDIERLPPPKLTLIADLHLHSRFSDGSRDIDWLAQQGRQFGCDVIALTDHTDLSNKRFNEQAYLDAIRSARQKYAPLRVLSGLEWNIPPLGGREHVSVLLPQLTENAELLKIFRQRFDNERNLSGEDALQAMAWLEQNFPGVLLFYNHPSRKDFSAKENLWDVKLWRQQQQLLVGFEGGPGHQRAGASYNWLYRTVHGWDPAVAVVGGQWDRLLQQGERFWGASSNSDYHTEKLDYRPCQFSRTHLLVSDNSEQSIFQALRHGRFYGSQGNFVRELDFRLQLPDAQMLYSGDEASVAARQAYQVSIDLNLHERDFSGHPAWLDKLELILITPDAIKAVPLYPERSGQRYQVSWQGQLDGDFVVVRVRGAMQTAEGQWHYFYTNPIRLLRSR
ncbi:hypothetical protein AEST_30500 [Alishewanella aestuarii B11]|uniref:Polymerase/histidinol phosphatase N-terminal domain-containing protein n=1 Tax=Alishewanella aestuarii B11 TaxID=1197174 RepID=J1QFE6_9ALTE|nr:CehA/McbA family metallohydrolase [Alishewanella aestuarii]EJI84216.1 hypothetical protein AEST_30500 [Alishewanella aestuarii B11]